MRLNFDLTTKLVLHTRLQELLFEEDLEGNDELALLLSRQVDVAELPLAQRLSNLKVLDRPTLLCDLLGDADGLYA